MQVRGAQAGDHAAAERRQHRALGGAAGQGVAAAGREGATVGRLERGHRPARDDRQARQPGVDGRSGPEEPLRIGVQRAVMEVHGPPHLDDRARIHDRGPVAHRGGELEVVGDEQQGETEPFPELGEDRHHLRLGGGIHRGGGLVGKQQPRLGRERSGDHDPLEEAARQLVGILGEACPGVLDPHRTEQLAGPLLAGPFRHVLVEPQALGEEVPDRSQRIGVGLWVLEDHRRLAGPVRPQLGR
jgi:hypothetical protein